jgi:deoxyribonucleoside regulator
MKRATSNSGYTDQQLVLASRLYYLDGMSQAEIGKFVRVSQSKVSRMLSIAQQRGLVRISVPEYESRNPQLEKELAKAFGIEAVVIHSVPGIEIKPLRQIVGYFAAPVVHSWLKSHSVVVLAGGRTIQSLIEQIQPVQNVFDLRIAQGMGHIDSTPGPYDAAELCRTLAQRWHASVLALNTPLVFPDKESCQKFVQLAQIQDVLKTIPKAEIALMGIGTLDDSVLVERAVYTRSELAELRKAGAVGELLGRFFDAKGVECKTDLRDRTLSLELTKLRHIKRRVALVVGADRATATIAAIRGGLVNTLITDESCSAELLQLASKNLAPAS